MLTALIMAGGRGTRFWPLSTEEKPKQFLNLIGNETMIQMTINRIKPIVPMERIFVCTVEDYVDLIKEQLPELPERNIIIEPVGRNTAPCIALSAFVIKKYYNNATMVVLPSDHLIRDEEEFRRIISNANEFVEKHDNSIVTLGMKPSRAETGYGYIKCGNDIQNINENQIVKVEAFVEKPHKEKAEEYLKNPSYLWNGGMFLWSANNILAQIRKYSPNTYEALHEIEEAKEEELRELINRKYSETEAISIDYAVLEKSKDIFVIPSEFGWDDIGSWEALDRYMEKDEFGNLNIGEVKAVKSKNNIIVSSNNEVIIDGISNIYIVENDGKIIIGRKNKIEKKKSLR